MKSHAAKKGMPNERFTFVPHPISGTAAAVCRKYLQGNDPITGKPVLQEIVGALTDPLTAEDSKKGFIEMPTPRLAPPDTADNLQRLFLENGWTDGLPVILPTEARVAEMLKGTSHKPDEVAGKMQPSPPHPAWTYTVEKVAVNAVMAGARPEHFPVILALAASGVPSLFTSTTSFARMMVVNGPIRNEIKMNAGIGALGPFNYANAVIGRAWTLMSITLDGGAKPGETYMGSQGNNLNYNNVTMPENEEALPAGWNPYHVQKGHKPQDSVISLFAGWGFGHPDQSFGHPFHSQIPRWLKSISPWSSATLLLDPTIVKQLKENEGFNSKEQLSEYIYQNTTITVGDWLDCCWSIQNFTLPAAKQGGPAAERMKLPRDTVVPQFSRASSINILSVGGGTNLFWQAGDFSYISSTSVDKWR